MSGDRGHSFGPAAAERLLARFLSSRAERTRAACAADVEDFGHWTGESPAAALARLLVAGPVAASHLAIEYAIELRDRGLARTTASRRLATLRAFVATARDLSLIEWSLEVPTEEQVAAAIRERALQASYMLPRHPSEMDRLDLQHYALSASIGGIVSAPVQSPGRVLDVGSGTGQWAIDVCARFPGVVAVGFDLVPGKARRPAATTSVATCCADCPSRTASSTWCTSGSW